MRTEAIKRRLLAKARGVEFKYGSTTRDIVRFDGIDYVVGETTEPYGAMDLDIIYPIYKKEEFDRVMSKGLQIKQIIY